MDFLRRDYDTRITTIQKEHEDKVVHIIYNEGKMNGFLRYQVYTFLRQGIGPPGRGLGCGLISCTRKRIRKTILLSPHLKVRRQRKTGDYQTVCTCSTARHAATGTPPTPVDPRSEYSKKQGLCGLWLFSLSDISVSYLKLGTDKCGFCVSVPVFAYYSAV